MSNPVVRAPARFVPVAALAYGERDADAQFVDPARPLPVALGRAAARSTPLAGTASSSQLIGPFLPECDRQVMLTLSGSWTGQVIVQRSDDGGATRHPLTLAGEPWARFAGNANEPVWSESATGVSLYLDCTITGGTLNYRMAQ
ncbi:hypothetical protein ACPVPU_11135 [Sphingomonas sp. CJ99]